MADRALVDRIVASKGFEEKDRAWLDALEDGQLKKFAAHCEHARMPGMAFGSPAPEPRAHRAQRPGLTPTHTWMPGLQFGS